MCRLSKLVFIYAFSALFLTAEGFAAIDSSGHLVSPDLLKAANLRIAWENSLPMNRNESLEQMLILGDQIYIMSSSNFAMSLDRNNGQRIFTRSLVSEGLKPEGFVFIDANDANNVNGEIMYHLGSKYIELEVANGIEKKSTEVGFGIVCPVVRNKSYFYVSGVDDRLHVYKAQDRAEMFKVAAKNDSLITSVIADEDFIVFGTDKGNIYSMLPGSPSSLWEFEAAGGIVGQIVRDSNSLYFSGQDMNVYRVDVSNLYTKNFIWKTLVPGMIQKAPRVTSNVVYQSAFSRNMSISAMDKDTGRLLWTLPKGIELLAESRGRAYIITEDNTLVVMDNASAKQIYSVNFTGVSRQAYNTVDSKIYIGNKSGKIACLEPLY